MSCLEQRVRLLGLVCTFVFISAVGPEHTTIGFSAVQMNSIWHEVE